MKLERTFLRSRVGRRIFGLFVACALVPVLALTLISFYHVGEELRNSGRNRLMQTSKAQGMAVVERLQFLDAELRLLALRGNLPSSGDGSWDIHERFRSVSLVSGAALRSAAFTPEQLEHLRAGKTLVRLESCPDAQQCVVLLRVVDSTWPGPDLVRAEANPAYLWDVNDLPSGMEQCTMDAETRPIVCSGGSAAGTRLLAQSRRSSGFLSWSNRQGGQDAAYWTVLLKPQFQTESWIVLVSQPRSDVLAPLLRFRATFPFVITLALLTVVLASLVQIRRTLVPLERLNRGAQEVGAQNFSARVDVSSGDEFEALAHSFNAMAGRLGQQFHALRTIHDIDRAILGSLNRDGIVDAVLGHMPDLLPFECFAITVLGSAPPENAGSTKYVTRDGRRQTMTETVAVLLSPRDFTQLGEHREMWKVQPGEPAPDFLSPLRQFSFASFLLLPIFLESRLFAVLAYADRKAVASSAEEERQARQVADQLAVAFSNVQLIEALQQLHWGTLTALARAIDAKSAWTAGHSERVTNLSLQIGRAMNLSAKDLQIMHRGGLLHDVGKIGTPALVLDKPGKLDENETKTMRDHVRIGVRILEPIPGFEEALPIVAQHHEWFNGSGYPEGLAGEQISLHARIFAVADCYDAMTSDRPYRKGLPHDRVVELLKQSSGVQFDPKVIEAFLRMCESGRGTGPDESEPVSRGVGA